MPEIMLVECRTLHGERKQIPVNRLTQRPSVYAITLHAGQVLLMRGRHTQKYTLPGGGVEVGEPIEQALKRELREETGLDIAVEEFLHFHEDFFYYDPLDLAFHGFLFYYRCTPLSDTLLAETEVDDEDAEAPRWIALDSLTAADFQTHGEITMRLLDQCSSR
ncbi:MAG: NUDIX domain-containing protein [Chloroflexi bacterium]|nr:NUDIX domain-containing protein [Chloroflexota bacterium]